MVNLLPKIYRKYVIMSSKGKKLPYFQIKKALYGLLHSAILLPRKLVKDLEAYGLQINPYNLCAANNMINEKYMMVVWHVDDLKVRPLGDDCTKQSMMLPNT